MPTTPGPDEPTGGEPVGGPPGEQPVGIEERLLGGPRRYRRAEAAEKAGLSVEYARRLWRAVGFADVGDEPVAFTDGDLAAIDRLKHLVEVGVLDDELAVSVTRAVGHNTARLAEWQFDALVEHLVEQGRTPEEAHRLAAEQSAEHLADFEQLMVAVWRRQLASVAGRVLAAAESETVTSRRSVGFADLVSYTRLSQRLEERELAAMVERFHRRTADVIAAGAGRLVKTVGDEVLFVADAPLPAALIGLAIAEAMGEDPVLPDVRVGIATGPVAMRMGDVFGTTVNLASRLTALAAPGTVLVDRDTADALEGADGLALDAGRTRAVRGLGLVRPGVVRRTR